MVGYYEYEKWYKIFDPSSQKTFIERSVQFEEEIMQEVELVEGDCSHSPLNDDVRDVSISNFYDYDMKYEDYDIHLYHEFSTRLKWVEKSIHVASDLAGDVLDTR